MWPRIRRVGWLYGAGALLLGTCVWQVTLISGRISRHAAWVSEGDHLPSVPVMYRGIELALDFDALGSCTYVVLFSPSCPFCQEVAPRWAREFAGSSGRTALALSLSDWAEAEAFAKAYALRLPVVATGQERATATAARLGVLAVPTILLLGHKGRVAAVAGGTSYELSELANAAGCATSPKAPVTSTS